MREIGKASEEDLPTGLRDALRAPVGETYYCVWCDGLRVRGHGCPPNEEFGTTGKKKDARKWPDDFRFGTNVMPKRFGEK